MTTNNHPITPPPELRRLWAQQAQRMDPHDPVAWIQHVSAQAARWGADQELEACCEWLDFYAAASEARDLRVARRLKPPSLKEQALEELSLISISPESGVRVSALDTIRRALEQLDD